MRISRERARQCPMHDLWFCQRIRESVDRERLVQRGIRDLLAATATAIDTVTATAIDTVTATATVHFLKKKWASDSDF
jgi:hypothetical protein